MTDDARTAAQASALFSPTRLRLAREHRRMTQTALGASVGVTPTAISQFEKPDGSRPSATTLLALADTLRFPPAFFAVGACPSSRGDGGGGEPGGGFFRSLRSFSAVDRRAALTVTQCVRDVADALEAWVRLPAVDYPRVPVGPEAPPEEVERAAASVRLAWGLTEGPVPHVLSLLEQHGLVCVRVALGQHSVDAFSVPFPERPVVVLGTDKDKHDRDRFTGSHELGHLVMHDLAAAGSKVLESQAHRFAGAFLMPAEDGGRVLPERADWRALIRLKQEWGMSIGALLRRAKDLGVMSETTYVQAQKYLTMRGWRTDEPGDLGAPETPRLLAAAIELAATQGGDLGALVDRTGWPRDLIEQILRASRDHRPTVPV